MMKVNKVFFISRAADGGCSVCAPDSIFVRRRKIKPK
jgi:hypothetical protein